MNNKIDEIMKSMTFDFFGNGKHKITPAQHLSSDNSLFLDVRAKEEIETVTFSLVHHMPVLQIPIDEIPDRLSEIPRDKKVGIFCASGVRSTMTYFYLRTLGFENVKIIEGGYAEIVAELKPGKLLTHIAQGKNKA